MSLFLRFKKDYYNYLISIILPVIITGLSIPIFKHLLGAEGYGSFSIYLNAVLIGTATTTGWVTQSVFRFYPSHANKFLFAKLAISVILITQLICFLPVLFFAWYIKRDLFLAIFICIAFLFTSLQFLYTALAQSSFLSKKTIYSETIRSVCYILIAVSFLSFTKINYLYVLFLAVIISFAASVFYLRIQTNKFLLDIDNNINIQLSLKSLTKTFFNYGAPLSMWFVFAYLLSYIDKIFLLKHLGAQIQGNYQAIFDMLAKGIGVLISPVIISLVPLLTQAYEKGEGVEIRQLLKKIILFEAGAFVLASILYWWFGANLLLFILKIPNNVTYKWMGFIAIAGTFVWQIAVVTHKPFELKLKSLFLFFMVAISFFSQVTFYWIFQESANPLIYPLGYLLSAVMYLFLVSFFQLPVIFKFKNINSSSILP